MIARFVEVTNGPNNWGKFMVAKFDDVELSYESRVDTGRPLLRAIGVLHPRIWVLDLQTGEGAMFSIFKSASAKADLDKHKIWVCPLFEPFLQWLYLQPDPMSIPQHVDLPDAPFDFRGYRRSGATDLPDGSPLFYTPDNMPLCGKHVVAAYEHMRPPYFDQESVQLQCAMCGQTPAPGRTCGHCSTPLHDEWPSVYCSNQCALADA